MKCIIMDIDGTISDSSHRSHLAQAGKWDDFHMAGGLDNVNKDVLQLVRIMDAAGYAIVAVTGCNEAYRSVKEKWFARHGVPVEALLMRPDGNYESDAVIKPRMFWEWVVGMESAGDEPNVLFALEDRDKMVDAWRANGIPCYQVREGTY